MTVKLDTMLTAHFNDLADEPMPGGALDVDRAIAGGKRLIAGRRILRASVGTAAVALAVVVGVTAVGVVPDGPGTGGAGFPHADDTGLAATLTGSDPLIMPISFGWLPAGYTADAADFSGGQYLGQADNGVPGDDFGLDYSAVAAGQSPPLAIPPPGFPAPPARLGHLPTTIDGHQAYWQYSLEQANLHSPATNETLALSWQVHGSEWASIDYISTSALLPDDIVDTFVHIADTVVVHDTKFPLPFHLPAAPSALPVIDVGYEALNRDQTAWTVSLYFGGLSCAYVGGSECLVISVVGNEANRLSDAAPTPSAGGQTVDVPEGSAVVYTKAGGSMIEATANGMQITIVALGSGNTFVQSRGGILAYFDSIVWLGTASSTWTTHVIG